MNSQIILAIFVTILTINYITAVPAAPANEQCGPNEEFHSCGTACPSTCQNPRPSGFCTKQCMVGCFCKQGYLRHENGQCIHETKCGNQIEMKPISKPTCGDNEEYLECKNCDGTCDNPNPICVKICRPGCACKKDHLRDSNGRCMHESKCLTKPSNPLPLLIKPEEPKCGPNEIFRSCGNGCPPTCENPQPDPFCTGHCVLGCFCQEGYLRNAKGVCVLEANCDDKKRVMFKAQIAPKIMPLRVPPPHDQCPTDREIYSECGSTQDCISRCDSPPVYLIHGVPQLPEKCKKMECAPACVCKSPYYRNAIGECVERKECQKTQ